MSQLYHTDKNSVQAAGAVKAAGAAQAGTIKKLLTLAGFAALCFFAAGCTLAQLPQPESKKDITAFSFESLGARGVIAESESADEGTITVTLPSGAEAQDLVATYAATGTRVVVNGREQVSGATANDFSEPLTYTVYAQDESTKNYVVSVEVTPADPDPEPDPEPDPNELSSDKAITAFTTNDSSESVYIDQEAGRIEITLGYDSSLTFSPSIQFTGVSISPESGVSRDFSQEVTYTVTAEDGTARDYAVAASLREAPNPGNFTISASRTSGVGPLSVVFSAENPSDPDVYSWFHGYEYSWDFGDPASGNWKTDGLPRNEAKGPIAAHVYEHAGTYTVSLTVSDGNTVLSTNYASVTVTDPDLFYAGEKTVCVSPDSNFAGAPAGSLHVTTTNLGTITKYAAAGRRVLLRKGASWSSSGLDWPDSAGPVTIGAFGSGDLPRVTITGNTFLDLAFKQDWRIMDIELTNPSKTASSFGGEMNMQRILLYRVTIRGFHDSIAWGHWHDRTVTTIEGMAIVDCDFADTQENVGYVGSERLAILGNRFANADTSHVLRVWQAYKSVISNNLISGSSIGNTNGRQALKLHGPMESELNPSPSNPAGLAHRSEFIVISDNTFGSSGPWPVSIAPQNEASDERISQVIFERNRYIADYGIENSTPLQLGFRFVARYVTIRNNVIDGSNAGPYFTGISVLRAGNVPAPVKVAVYNNTVYKTGNNGYEDWVGVEITSGVTDSVVKNNLVCFPQAASNAYGVVNNGTGVTVSNNLLSRTVSFVDPGNPDPLARDYSLRAGSAGIDQGTYVPIFEDLSGAERPQGAGWDIGAYER